MKLLLGTFKSFALALCLATTLSACGGDGQPFVMEVDSTLFVADNSGTSLSFIVDPIQQNPTGTLEAQVVQEFNDHFELEVLSFNLSANFEGVGEIQFVLDPNFTSQMSVSKLNRNNNPFGPNVLDLSLIVETPEQNLTLSNLIFSSNNAILQLSENLPPLGFTANDQSFALTVSAIDIIIPSELIVSDFDPQ